MSLEQLLDKDWKVKSEMMIWELLEEVLNPFLDTMRAQLKL